MQNYSNSKSYGSKNNENIIPHRNTEYINTNRNVFKDGSENVIEEDFDFNGDSLFIKKGYNINMNFLDIMEDIEDIIEISDDNTVDFQNQETNSMFIMEIAPKIAINNNIIEEIFNFNKNDIKLNDKYNNNSIKYGIMDRNISTYGLINRHMIANKPIVHFTSK